MVQTINDRIIIEFTKLISKQIDEIKDTMAHGTLQGWEHYKFLSGRVAGLAEAEELLDEARKIVYGVEE